jgi:DNA-binding NtrC family response regulator
LRVIDVILPPLRERGDDVLLLADHFIAKIAPKVGKSIGGISDQARQLLLDYPWPGNVRELEHVIERACVLCQGAALSADQLPAEIVAHRQPEERLPTENDLERSASPAAPTIAPDISPTQRILQALKKAGGNKAKAARLLGVDRTTLYRKIRELRLDLSQIDV